jgi:hypothetical protein
MDGPEGTERLPRTTERSTRESGDEPRSNSVMRKRRGPLPAQSAVRGLPKDLLDLVKKPFR